MSVENERMFLTFSFMKTKLWNKLNEHLLTIVGMFLQYFFHSGKLPL